MVTLVTNLGYLFNPVRVVVMSPLVHLFVFIDSALGRKDPKNRWNQSRTHLRLYQNMALATSQAPWTNSGFRRCLPD
jgi:hypothetical protein